MRYLNSVLVGFVILALHCSFLHLYGWTIEVIDSSEIFAGGRISLDSNVPKVSYQRASPGPRWLKYAFKEGAEWTTSVVDSSGRVGGFASIATDKSGNPHIGYYDYDNKDLKYSYFDGNRWTVSTIDTAGDVGMFTSIALDSSGLPRISYLDATRQVLKCAEMKTDGGWTTSIIQDQGDYGHYSVLQIDSSNYPRIIYTRFGSTIDLRYAWRDQSGWHTSTVDTNSGDNYCGLILDHDDNPHVSYIYNGGDFQNLDLKYAFLENSSWHNQIVDTTGNTGNGTSIDLDILENPHISYSGNGKIYHAYREEGNWEIEDVDTVYQGGQGWVVTSINIDDQNNIHLVYEDPNEYALRYALREETKIGGDNPLKKKNEEEIILHQSYPNPTNPATTIAFSLEGEEVTNTSLMIYNIRGQRVRCLFGGPLPPGSYKYTWDGRDDHNQKVGSGVYFCVLSIDRGTSRSRKIVVTR